MVIENHFLQLLLILLVILPAAKLAGYASIRLGQPSVLGELLVGVVLGPTLLNLLDLPVLANAENAQIIKTFGELGVLLLMFVAGLELHVNELRHTGKVAALAGTLGVAVPVGLGWATGLAFGLPMDASIFLGLTLGATSVSISAQTLMELKALRSRMGLGLLGAAVFDDVLVILLLSLFFGLTEGGGNLAAALAVIGRMGLFLGLAGAFGLWALPQLVRWARSLPVSQSVLSLAIAVILAYALAAELLGGMASITGAFFAGLMFARSPERETLEPRISALAYGFFVPIFFVDIGLEANLGSILAAPWLTFAVALVAIAGKLLGAGAGARLGGFTWQESLQLGTGMVSRGEVGLIVAAVGVQAGFVASTTLSAIVGMIVVTTLVTPPLLKSLFRPQAASSPQ